MNITSVVNKVSSAVNDTAKKAATSITQKASSANASGVMSSKVLQYLDCRAKGFLYFNRLHKITPLIEDFNKTIRMDNLASKHFYYGLEADTIEIGSFAQKSSDFMARVQEAKANSSEAGLIETLRKLVDLDVIKFTKLDTSNPQRDLYFDDPKSLEKFRKILFE